MDTSEFRTGSGVIAAQLGFEELAGPVESSYYELPPEKGRGYIYQLHQGDGFFISVGDYTLLHTVERTYNINQECMEIYFFESGDIKNIENGKKTHQISQGVNVFVNRKKPGRIIYGAGLPVRYVSIVLFGQFIQDRIQNQFPEDCFDMSQALDWKNHNYNTPELSLAFLQLKQNIKAGETKRMYYEGKVGEILSLIMSNYKTGGNLYRLAARQLPSADLSCLRQVKSEIDRKFIHPPTIADLCRLSGMGLTKLKESFKRIYGIPIYGYLREVRMKHALLLLSDDTQSIKAVSLAVGFTSPGKFALAFKKIYGMSPKEYQKGLKAGILPTPVLETSNRVTFS